MKKALLALWLTTCCTFSSWAGDYSRNEELQAVITELEQEKVYAPGELASLFEHVTRQEKALAAMSRPAEAVKEWKDYGPPFLTSERVDQGVQFWQANQLSLERAFKVYGVPPEIIIGILGVETRYGVSQGRFRTVDTLATLAFDYPARAPFFRHELMEFLRLAHEQKLDPLEVYGSYAGALGYPQFMPSNWRSLAVDFDGDGRKDLINNPTDAIGSIGNYFRSHGWQAGQPVALRAQIVNQNYDTAVSKDLGTSSDLGDLAKKGLAARDSSTLPATTPASAIRLQGESGAEFWLALNNFYVITSYNHSTLYAMSVFQLAERVRLAREQLLAQARNQVMPAATAASAATSGVAP